MAEFWLATPRLIDLVLRGYKRRRGWMAWHTAVLGRMDGKNMPSLADLIGENRHAEPASTAAQPAVMMAHNLRLWRALIHKGT